MILRTMAQLLEAPTEGYEDAIVLPDLLKKNPRSILTWDDLVSKFINKFFPPSKTTNLRNEITRFQQKFDETFYEAWDRFNDLLRGCPHHGFSELHQLDTFYNSLNSNDQDSLNSAAGVSTSSSTPAVSSDVAELKDMVRALILDKKNQTPAPAPVKAVEQSCVTCGGGHSYQNCPATNGNIYRDNIQEYVSQAAAVNYNQGNASYRPQMVANQIRPPGQVYQPQINQPPTFQAPVPPAPVPILVSVGCQKPGHLAARLGCAETKVATWDDLAFKLIILGWNVKHSIFLALDGLGASIILMPLSVWKRLSLQELTPTCMTLELADRSITQPIGIAEDVYVKVGKFHFPADFVVVDFDADPRVPLILGRSFLKTGRALIDVYKGELTLCVGKEAVTFNLDQTSRYSSNYDDMTANRIDVIELACEEYSQEVLGFSDVIASGNPTPYYDPIVSTSSPTLTPFGDSDFLLLEEADAFLALEDDPTSPKVDDSYYDSEGDILLLEAILNSDPSQKFEKNIKFMKLNLQIEELSHVNSRDLPPHLEYVFLEGDDKLSVIIAKDLSVEEKATLIKVLKSRKRAIAWKLSDIKGYFQIPIDPKDQEKITFTCPYGTFAYCRMPFGLCNAQGTFQMCMLAIFHYMVKKTMEFFMDDFSVFGNSFENCLSRLDKILQRCEDTNLVLNWEKSYFMVKEGIVLGHKISKSGIEVDRAKVDVIAKIPHPTTVKGDFAIGAVLGQRKNKHFQPIHYASKTMTEAQAHYTTTENELLAVVYAFEKFWSYLVLSKSIVYTNHSAIKYLFAKKDAKARLMRWILLLQEFNVEIRDKKGAENLAADHLSRLENPH
ncbi:reverse transcriptase domain-containing protein [Tanacetum coccineum]